MNRDQPCYNNGRGCKDRYPGCHDLCPRFKIWRAELDRKKQNSGGDIAVKSYTIDMMDKQKRKAHGRKR